MQFDTAQHSHADNYKLLVNLVVPRPIAWVTSVSESGVVNLAPFSFFNAVSGAPLYLMFSVGRRNNGELKDTARNILHNREFVVHMVDEALIDAMNISGADLLPEESEVAAAGLQLAESVHIKPPRLAAAQAAMECRLHQVLELGQNHVFIGEILMFHVADHLLGERMRIYGFTPIGRMGSPATYCRTTDRFELPRLSRADINR